MERDLARVQFDPNVHEALGEYIVHGQQQYRGLSIYPHSIVVHVSGDGEASAGGRPLIDVSAVSTISDISPRQAVLAAYRHVQAGEAEQCHTPHAPRLARRRYQPRVVAAFPMPNRPTVLTAGPFGEPVQTNLVIFRDSVRLAWLVWMYIKSVADFTLVIAASGHDAGKVLYCAVEAASAACTADVYLFNPDEAARVSMTFPRAVGDYPPGLVPAGLNFHDWVEKDRTIGNNVETLFGNKDPKIRLTAGGPLGKQFVTTPGSDDEQVVNAFFLCNFAHDLFSLIGFGEEDGNFQQENVSKKGEADDRLILSIVRKALGEANVRAQNDGLPVELTLGIWDTPNGKPSALDADVVLHEFTHCVSQRLVGGKQKKGALLEPQSLALGEAWSDYFAITIQNFYRQNAARFTFAAYASQNTGGVRPTGDHPVSYDQLDPANSHFGMLGTPPFDEQHAAGSVFAAALIRMQEGLRAELGDAEGHAAGWRLIIASMKALAANPTFIDARNAILQAVPKLMPVHAPALDAAIRDAFARFGLGRNARCNDTSFAGIQADFNP